MTLDELLARTGGDEPWISLRTDVVAALVRVAMAAERIVHRDTSDYAKFSQPISQELAAAMAWDLDADILRPDSVSLITALGAKP